MYSYGFFFFGEAVIPCQIIVSNLRINLFCVLFAWWWFLVKPKHVVLNHLIHKNNCDWRVLSICVTFIPLKSVASCLCNHDERNRRPRDKATQLISRILTEPASSVTVGPSDRYLYSASIWLHMTGHSLFHSGFSRLLHSIPTMSEILYWNKITGLSFRVLCRVPSSSDLIRYSVNEGSWQHQHTVAQLKFLTSLIPSPTV